MSIFDKYSNYVEQMSRQVMQATIGPFAFPRVMMTRYELRMDDHGHSPTPVFNVEFQVIPSFDCPTNSPTLWQRYTAYIDRIRGGLGG